jgi:hypothetical protein
MRPPSTRWQQRRVHPWRTQVSPPLSWRLTRREQRTTATRRLQPRADKPASERVGGARRWAWPSPLQAVQSCLCLCGLRQACGCDMQLGAARNCATYSGTAQRLHSWLGRAVSHECNAMCHSWWAATLILPRLAVCQQCPWRTNKSNTLCPCSASHAGFYFNEKQFCLHRSTHSHLRCATHSAVTAVGPRARDAHAWCKQIY